MMTLAGKRFAIAALLLTALCGCAQTLPVELRYQLRTGDHLVYREVFERELQSGDINFRTRAVFVNHLLVVGDANGNALLGVQRNRQSAELLAYSEHGKDKLAERLPTFSEALAKRPAHFLDATVYSAIGVPQTPVQVVREAYSKLLYLVSEIPPLPSQAVQPGSEWNDQRLGLQVQLSGFETVAGENCAVVEDNHSRKDLHVRYDFCPQSSLVRKLDFEGEYRGFADQRFHEKVTFELIESHSGENPAAWLIDRQTQGAALRAYLISNGPLPYTEAVAALLSTGTPEVQALALAVFLQHKTSPPPDTVRSFANSSDPEVRRVASGLGAAVVNDDNICPPMSNTFEPQSPGTTLHHMRTTGFTEVPYVVRVPIDYRPDHASPLIIYLSGGGGLALDAALSAEDALRRSGYLVLYPHAGGDMWWNSRPTEMVGALINEFLHTYNVDTNRVYLTGASNGGTASVWYGTLWPYRFAAISSLMGAGMYAPGDNSVQWPMVNLLNVPMLFLHGDKDKIIPEQASVGTYDELKRLRPRVAPELHILKKREHDLTLASEDGQTLPFFQRFVRDNFPRNVAAKISGGKFGRHYWIEVLEQKGEAEIEGHILPDNTIDIKTHNVRKLRVLLRPELLSANAPFRLRVNGKERFSGELKKDCQLFQQSAQDLADPWLAYTQQITVDLSH